MAGALLSGRATLVTGAARGLGRAIARRFATEGALGASLDRDGAAAIAAAPEGWLGLAADVTDEGELARAVQATVERFGRLDIVVANAGVVPPWRETEELDLAEWDAVFAVNVKGVAATIKHAVPALRAAGGGAVIVMASINATRAHPRQCLYTATKHAVLGIVRATAQDLGRYAIRVNAIAPGPIATDALLERMAARAAAGGPAPAEALLRHAGETALERVASEAEVAAAAVFLGCDLSGGMTGACIPVDAGLP